MNFIALFCRFFVQIRPFGKDLTVFDGNNIAEECWSGASILAHSFRHSLCFFRARQMFQNTLFSATTRVEPCIVFSKCELIKSNLLALLGKDFTWISKFYMNLCEKSFLRNQRFQMLRFFRSKVKHFFNGYIVSSKCSCARICCSL